MNIMGYNLNIQNIGLYAELSIFCVIIAIVFWWVWYKSRFNIDVEIEEKVGDATLITFDKGWLRKDKYDGVNKLRLFKTKINLPEPESRFFAFLRKGVKHIKYHRVSKDKFYPIEFDLSEPYKLKSIPTSLDMWRIQEMKKTETLYKTENFWMKYGGLIIGGIIVIIAGALMIMAIDKSGEVSLKTLDTINSISEPLKKIADALLKSASIK